MTKNRVYELMLKCDKNLDNIFENYEACISSYREEQINEILRYVETTPTAALDYDFLVLYKRLIDKNDIISKYKLIRYIFDNKKYISCACLTSVAILIAGMLSIIFE